MKGVAMNNDIIKLLNLEQFKLGKGIIMQQTKLIEEVFSDYKTEENIKKAKILSLNFLKKANILEINLESEDYIELKELWYFEKFLKERFQFSNIDIKMKYSENVKIR